MKILNYQTGLVLFAVLFGVCEIAGSADDAGAGPSNDSAAALAEAKLAISATKRTAGARGPLADSLSWLAVNDSRPSKKVPLTPPPVVVEDDKPAAAKSRSEPVVQTPAPPVAQPQPTMIQPAGLPQTVAPLAVAYPQVASQPAAFQQVAYQQPAVPQYQQQFTLPQERSVASQQLPISFQQQVPAVEPMTYSIAESVCTTCEDCCPDPLDCHRCGVWADFLYLRPGEIDYIYAVEQTGPLPTDSPTGQVGRVGFDAMPGWRVGATMPICDCSSIQASYTWFQATTSNTITADGINVLVFQPGIPPIPNVGATSIEASADYAIRFQKFNVDYRSLLYGTCDSAVNYFAGVRYVNLEQNFHARQNVGVAVGLSDVRTDINVDAFGIGFGLDAIKRRSDCGLFAYGRTAASFVAGEMQADIRQTLQFVPSATIGNSLRDYRVLSILDAELGVGWQTCCGRLKLSAGYEFSGWFNALTVPTYILGVQNREFSEMIETISFNGLVARALVQF